jgi:hypothetical protein
MTHLFTQLQTPLPLRNSVNALEFGKEVIQQQIDNLSLLRLLHIKPSFYVRLLLLFSKSQSIKLSPQILKQSD